MRILHILDHSLPVQSGYSYRTLGVLREQAAAGLEVLALTGPKQPPSPGLREFADGWEFFRTQAPKVVAFAPGVVKEHATVRAIARRLEDLVGKWRPSVLHAHSPVLNALATLRVGAKFRVPVVYEVRALWEDALICHGAMKPHSVRYAMAQHLETYAVRRADAVVTISNGLCRELCARGMRAEDIFVVPNAVDVGRFQPAEPTCAPDAAQPRDPVVGFIGSFYAYEGLDLLLEAAKRVIATRPSLRLVLVGGGREEASLQRLHATSNLGDKVTLTGWLPHDRILDAYRKIDIFVYPRRRNRLTELVTPLKPLEAMAMGKVVLASDVGGHRELIENGCTGFLFKADDVSDLSRQLGRLLEARHTWSRIGRAARQFVERERAWTTVAAIYASVYEKAVLGGRRPR